MITVSMHLTNMHCNNLYQGHDYHSMHVKKSLNFSEKNFILMLRNYVTVKAMKITINLP